MPNQKQFTNLSDQKKKKKICSMSGERAFTEVLKQIQGLLGVIALNPDNAVSPSVRGNFMEVPPALFP